MPANSASVNIHPVVLLGCSQAGTADALAAQLESWRYQVELARSGTEAMAAMQAPEPPFIALLDIDLPSPGGVEIARALRDIRERETRKPWVVLLSCRSDKDRLRAALECGCDDFLLTPPDASDLKLRIRIAERVLALAGQLQRQSAEVRYHSTHDGLTGMWNREALLSLIFQETDRVQRMKTDLSLMLLDLDDFSRVNHDYGYEAGDRVLAELANRFRRQLRSYDLIGRCGEDEFLLALPGCDLENAHLLATRIREALLARPFAAGQEATTMTASFGLAVSRGRSPLVVLREAERALAEAKLAGKNGIRGHNPDPRVPGLDLAISIVGAPPPGADLD
jgi:two-component system, cell cycle response regulator